MSALVKSVKGYGTKLLQAREILISLVLVGSLVIMIAPISPMMLDMMLSVNITFSLVLLLTTVYVQRPLDFSVFPSLLLVATLFRLSLNIATTRLVLGNAGELKEKAAGEVVALFGEFVGGQNLFIGITIFFIIFVINFIVVTKGATRISEVAARFTLDSLPGQQMAIDADLNAGLIDDKEARKRREELRQTTDFYGAMDGASKFVRGDAVAGIIITIINIVVGFIIGAVQYNMGFAEAGRVFTKLTIGDGLVSQIPALLISVGSGLIVTRSAGRAKLGIEVVNQLFGQRQAVGLAALMLLGLAVAGILGFPFPVFPFLVVGGCCGAGWYMMGVALTVKEEKAKAAAGHAPGAPGSPAGAAGAAGGAAAAPEKVENYLLVDPMALEIGYALVPMVDSGQAGGGGLLQRVQAIRKQIATDLGFIVPPVRIRDDIRLDANEYVIKIHGASVARGKIMPERLLAMDSGMATRPIQGVSTKEPAFGLPAFWIQPPQQSEAEAAGYTVVDAETVLATHLTEVVKNRAHEILTREEVRNLLKNLSEKSPSLVSEVVPSPLSAVEVQKVLQNLLRERVSIRNLPSILEALGDFGRRTKDIEILTEYARNSLARWLCNEYAGPDNVIRVATLDPRAEERIQQAIEHTDGGSFLTLRPVDTQKIVEAVGKAVQTLVVAGHQPVLLTSPQVRAQVKRMTESSLPMLTVLSYNEIMPDYTVESLSMANAD